MGSFLAALRGRHDCPALSVIHTYVESGVLLFGVSAVWLAAANFGHPRRPNKSTAANLSGGCSRCWIHG